MAMRDWVAGAMLVLGILLVLGGAAVVVLNALRPSNTADPAEPTQEVPSAGALPATGRSGLVGAVRRLPDGHRLIAWGVVLLVLAALAAGAIVFDLSAKAGTK